MRIEFKHGKIVVYNDDGAICFQRSTSSQKLNEAQVREYVIQWMAELVDAAPIVGAYVPIEDKSLIILVNRFPWDGGLFPIDAAFHDLSKYVDDDELPLLRKLIEKRASHHNATLEKVSSPS